MSDSQNIFYFFSTKWLEVQSKLWLGSKMMKETKHENLKHIQDKHRKLVPKLRHWPRNIKLNIDKNTYDT